MAITEDAPAHMWFVKTGGEVWGPYPEARIAAFAREGRVRPTTLLSPFPKGPWSPAADSLEFAAPLGSRPLAAPAPQARPAAQPPPGRAPRPAPERTTVATAPTPAPSGPARPLLIFAQLASVAPAAFQAALARMGPCAQIRPDLWLVRSTLGAAALRNTLSARLSGGDSLLVVEAPLDQAAWFNLAPAQDRDLRRLWGGH